MDLVKEYEITRIEQDTIQMVNDQVIVEHNLALYLNNRLFCKLLCAPNNLEALIYGRLFTQGIIRDKSHVKSLVIHDTQADVVLNSELDPDNPAFRVDLVHSLPVQILQADQLFTAVETFDHESSLFASTGGVHSCALCQNDGKRIFVEDIGRHNAIDKAFGRALLEAWDVSQAFLITSGRVPEDAIMKALTTGLSIVISRSAPTHAAVDLARRSNITLCGFARGRRMNIYSAPERILL
jgi:FdhD protein